MSPNLLSDEGRDTWCLQRASVPDPGSKSIAWARNLLDGGGDGPLGRLKDPAPDHGSAMSVRK
jgi:hypothetical protein